MSINSGLQSSSAQSLANKGRPDVFQDLPLIYRETRLTVMESNQSDQQIINELVYRLCRLITRPKGPLDKMACPSDTVTQDMRRVLILDMIGSTNPIRLATILKRDDKRMRMIGMARGCRINSTYVTLNSYLNRQANLRNTCLKLVVVYHDEFFILKTLNLLKQFIQNSKSQVILIVPRLDRQERDVLNLLSNHQILRCDFNINRRAIGPAAPESTSQSYQSYLNQLSIQRYPPNKLMPDKVEGELKETGLHLHLPGHQAKERACDDSEGNRPYKRIKSENLIS